MWLVFAMSVGCRVSLMFVILAGMISLSVIADWVERTFCQ